MGILNYQVFHAYIYTRWQFFHGKAGGLVLLVIHLKERSSCNVNDIAFRTGGNCQSVLHYPRQIVVDQNIYSTNLKGNVEGPHWKHCVTSSSRPAQAQENALRCSVKANAASLLHCWRWMENVLQN
jgi:hypothetical protein